MLGPDHRRPKRANFAALAALTSTGAVLSIERGRRKALSGSVCREEKGSGWQVPGSALVILWPISSLRRDIDAAVSACADGRQRRTALRVTVRSVTFAVPAPQRNAREDVFHLPERAFVRSG